MAPLAWRPCSGSRRGVIPVDAAVGGSGDRATEAGRFFRLLASEEGVHLWQFNADDVASIVGTYRLEDIWRISGEALEMKQKSVVYMPTPTPGYVV